MEYEFILVSMCFLGFIAFLFAMLYANKNQKREVIMMPTPASSTQNKAPPTVVASLPPPPPLPEQTTSPITEEPKTETSETNKPEPEAPMTKPKPEPTLYRYTASCSKLKPLENIIKGLRSLNIPYTTGYNPASTDNEQPQNILVFTSAELNGLEDAEKQGVHLKKEKIEKTIS
jgi:type IV secretory pathway VirB10-like protein